MTAAMAAGLAGCPSDEGLTSQAATPAVLYPSGQQAFGLTDSRVEELTRTVSPADIGEISLTSYLAVHGRTKAHDQQIPAQFDVPEGGAHSLGILAMPAPGALGQDLNPLAEQPLGELLTGDRGRRFLSQSDAVETPEFEWTSGPTQVGTTEVEFLRSAASTESYVGVATEGEDSRTVLATMARVENEGDVVLVGELLWRQTPLEPLDKQEDCADDLCQLSESALGDVLGRFEAGAPYVSSCPELARQTGGNIDQLCSSSGVPDTGPRPKFSITNARLVQHVENTQVQGTGSPPQVFHEEPDPDLVRGENTAVLFEFDTLENLDQMVSPLQLVVFSGNSGSGGQYEREGVLELSDTQLKRIKGGADTAAVLHDVSTDDSISTENPVFDLETGDVKIRPALDPLVDTAGASATITTPSDDIRDVEPLKIGFIPVRDTPTSPASPFSNLSPGDRYGTATGTPRAPLRSFESATEYLQRAYPGDVVAYLHTVQPFPGRADEDDAIRDEMAKVKTRLNNIATGTLFQQSNFPNGGTLRLDGRNRSRMVQEIRNSGFDATVAIVPAVASNNPNSGGYFPYHNKSGWVGVAFGPGQAVVVNGASQAGIDRNISFTTAQEVGHFFQDDYLGPTYPNKADHPMAQRRDPSDPFHKTVDGLPLDKDHARDQDSQHDRDDRTDDPGVVSDAYDLEDGFANVQHYQNPGGNFSPQGPGDQFSCGDDDGCQTISSDSINGVPSYMSYTGSEARAWTDARVHQQLIDTGTGSRWDAGLFGDASATYVLTARGSVDESGGVQYDSVTALQGVDRHVDGEDNPVEVALENPSGETLASARVPVSSAPTHAHSDTEVQPAPTFLLPFEPGTVRVRTTYDGQTTSMNPIVRSVRDAVSRVPPRGFAGSLEAGRATVDEALDEIAALMQEQAYADAAVVMDGDVRKRIDEAVVEYDAALDQRTPEAFSALIERMTERLRAAE